MARQISGLLLAALEARPRHGYAVKEALRDSSAGQIDLPTGTIYPALHRLEQAGLVRGTWDTTGTRPRRTYQLTAAGRRALSGERQHWRDFAATVTALLESRPCPSTP